MTEKPQRWANSNPADMTWGTVTLFIRDQGHIDKHGRVLRPPGIDRTASLECDDGTVIWPQAQDVWTPDAQTQVGTDKAETPHYDAREQNSGREH